MIPRTPLGLALTALLVVGVVVGSLSVHRPRPTTPPLPPAPSVIAGGTARPSSSPGVLGARVECPDAGVCTLTWETARLPVRVYAGPSPTAIDRTAPVAVAVGGDSLTVAVDPDGPTYLEVVADGDDRGPVVTARDLGLRTAAVRDLGGYRTRAGAPVAWGRWLVADDLTGLDAADRDRLATLSVASRCPATDTRPVGDPTRPAARRRDAARLRRWSAGPTTWVRCAASAGDWPVVLALTAAGVPRETVVAAVLALQTAEGRTPDRRAVDRPLQRIDARYGSFGRYLTDGLGWSRADRGRFRTAALTTPAR